MARWTLTSLIHIPTATTLRVGATTNKEGHLWMSWSYTRPGRTRIYRTVRGKMIFCGYKYVWDTPNIEEQTAEGDTLGHIFYMTNLISESRIWYYLHEPQPPSEWECQGGLQFVDLLHAGAPGAYLYFASRLLGMFMTTSFSDIGEPQPVWVPDNDGLLSLEISQAVLDPFIPEHYRYVIAGPHLYRHHNPVDFGPATATTILTWPEAIALTGSVDGDILWVEPNPHHNGMLHVVWMSQAGDNGSWHLRSLDWGEHWTATQIEGPWTHGDVGNIQAGVSKGTSPYPAGDVLYVAFNLDIGSAPHIAHSNDQGATWTTRNGPDQARGAFRPRLYIDPSNQAVVYMGCHPGFPKLYRSKDHGDSWDRIADDLAVTITLEPQPSHADIRAHPANPNLVRQFRRWWLTRTDDFWDSYERHGPGPEACHTHKFTNDNPNMLYLARCRGGEAASPLSRATVIFISTDEGVTLHPKAGEHAGQGDGGGDSIPWTCGGAADDGILIVQ